METAQAEESDEQAEKPGGLVGEPVAGRVVVAEHEGDDEEKEDDTQVFSAPDTHRQSTDRTVGE